MPPPGVEPGFTDGSAAMSDRLAIGANRTKTAGILGGRITSGQG